jgi:hypothetical protein
MALRVSLDLTHQLTMALQTSRRLDNKEYQIPTQLPSLDHIEKCVAKAKLDIQEELSSLSINFIIDFFFS